ncbi:MAG TPA: PP2C family protein-serine/threonine phosphatase [Actinospica sp.]|nr:PP2C family protein-serine/threonine phosphatase [Actinospica sp.]
MTPVSVSGPDDTGRISRAEPAAYAVLERELQIGREIQAGFLPEHLPVPPGWELEAEFRPARQVAGDFYDVFDLSVSQRTAVIVADVCDKGVGAALFMALIRTLLRHTVETGGLHAMSTVGWDPRDGLPGVGEAPLLHAVNSTNRYLTRVHRQQGYFATLFFGILDAASGSLSYINGGHNPPLHVGADGRLLGELAPTGPAVGVLHGADFRVGRVRLGLGESLFLFTDGVTDCRSSGGEFFGEQRLIDLATVPAPSARAQIERIVRAMEDHGRDGEQHDDITLLVLRRTAGTPITVRNSSS